MRPDRLYLLDIIEAASRLSEPLRRTYPATPWAKIVSFRNVVVHEYFGMNWEIVWDTATDLVPELRRQVASVLKAEFP